MYVLNAEIEDKKTLDALIEIYKLLGLKPRKFKMDAHYKDIENARKEIKKGEFSTYDEVLKKIKKK